ncbi:MAG: hypothetical protein GY786_21765 [Proteobacteria bacterium]|nr:hypothetical protein [Pseudomonadota bacterium]
MDPEIITALAASAVSALKLLFTKGSEEVAKSAFKDAYQAIKTRLTRTPESQKVIENFEADPEKGATELQSTLSEHLVSDDKLYVMIVDALAKAGTLKNHPLAEKIIAEKVVIANKIDTVNM